MEEVTKLKLIFLTFLSGGNKIHSYKLSFDHNNLYIIHNSEENYDIPEEVFVYGKDKAIISIILYDSSNKYLTTIKFPIYYHSINSIYIEEHYIGNESNIEIDFQSSKDLTVKINEKEFKIFDNIGTKDRQKITLINFNTPSITVNQKVISVISEISNCKVKSPINFYRLSMNMEDPDLKIIVQPMKEICEPKVHLLNGVKTFLDEFYSKFKELLLIKKTDNFTKRYSLILNECVNKIPYVNYELNKSINYLEQYFKEYPIDFDIIFKYELFYLFRDGEEKYKKNKELFEKIVERMNHFYDKIKNETKIKIYDKICLLAKISNIYLLCKTLEDLDTINIFYIITSDCAENSIIDKTKKMLNNFILNLSEDSKIFPYLLKIDSGIGYYNNKAVYTFDMSNLNMIKSHLNALFPRIILFYNFDNDNLGDTNKNSGSVSLNVHQFTLIKEEYETIIFDKEIEDEDFSNDMAINMFIILLHELGGHKKITYNKNIDEESISPKKIINEKNKLVELKRYSSYKNDDNGYILTSENSEEGEGESGKYLELCFGKYNKELISSLILYIKDKGKLLERVDLFVGKNCDVLQKYVILKTKVEENNIKINMPKHLSIEEEIEELEKIFNNSKAQKLSDQNIKSIKKIKKFKTLGKKRKLKKDISYINKSNKLKRNEESHIQINLKLNKNKTNELELEEEHKKENILEEKKKAEKKIEKEKIIVDYEDSEKRLKTLKKHIREKYGFKNKIEMIKGIKQIINEHSVSVKELSDLHFVLRFLYEVK